MTLRVKLLKDALSVASNEFRQFRRNRTAIAISLVLLPIFFTAALGGALGGAGSRFSATSQIPIAFVDDDLSPASGRLWDRLVWSGDFAHLVQGYREDSAIAELGTGRIYAAIVVPKGFQEKLANGQTSTIILYADDGEPEVADQILSTLRKHVQDFNPTVEVQPLQKDGLSQAVIIQKGAIFSAFNIGLATLLAVVQIFATFYEIAGGMVREHEDGTYPRLLLSPVGLGSIMFGKTLYDLVLGTARTLIVLGLAIYVYGARPNTDIGTLLVISLLIALLTMGFGFLVSSLRVSARAVVIVEFFLVLFLLGFSGLAIEKELLRGIARTIAYVQPWAYGFDALTRTILTGQPLLSLTSELRIITFAIIVFYALSYALLALWRERLLL